MTPEVSLLSYNVNFLFGFNQTHKLIFRGEICIASEANSASSNKRMKNDCIVDVTSRFIDSFEKYLQSNKSPPQLDSKEMYVVVPKVVRLD